MLGTSVPVLVTDFDVTVAPDTDDNSGVVKSPQSCSADIRSRCCCSPRYWISGLTFDSRLENAIAPGFGVTDGPRKAGYLRRVPSDQPGFTVLDSLSNEGLGFLSHSLRYRL